MKTKKTGTRATTLAALWNLMIHARHIDEHLAALERADAKFQNDPTEENLERLILANDGYEAALRIPEDIVEQYRAAKYADEEIDDADDAATPKELRRKADALHERADKKRRSATKIVKRAGKAIAGYGDWRKQIAPKTNNSDKVAAGIEADCRFFAQQETDRAYEDATPLLDEADKLDERGYELEDRASKMRLVRVVKASGHFEFRWAADEAEARTMANEAVKAGAMLLVEILDSNETPVKAFTNANATEKLTPRAAFAKHAQRTIAAKRRVKVQNPDEARTGTPNAAAWEVAFVNDDDDVPEGITFGAEESDRAREMYLAAQEAGEKVVLLKDGRLYETNIPNVGIAKNELAYVRKMRVTVNGLEWIETIRKLVSPTMAYIARLTNTEPGEAIFMLEERITGLDSYDEAVRDSAQCAKRILEHAIHGLEVDGVMYRPYGHGTNAGKDGVVSFCPQNIITRVRQFQNAGARPTWLITPAKFNAYNGLSDVAVKKFEDVLGAKVTPKDVLFFETLTTEVSDPNGIVEFDEKGAVNWINAIVQKCSDGSAVLSLTEEWLEANVPDPIERSKVRKMYEELSGHSFRMPLMKGYLTVMPIGGMHAFARILGHELDPMKILFCDMTVFKGSFGPDGSHADMAEFINMFNKLECSSGLLLKAHKPSEQELNMLNAQAWRGLYGISRKTLDALYDDEVERIMAISDGKLIGGVLGKLVDEVESMKQLPAIKRYAKAQRRKLLTEAAQGRFHGLVLNLAGNGDIFRWAAKQFGEEFVSIPAGCVVCRGLPLDYEAQDGVIGRSPSFGLCVAKMFASFKALYEYMGWDVTIGAFLDSITKEDGTIFFSADDDIVTRLQGDFDGDHFFVILNKRFVDAVKEAHNVNKIPFFTSTGTKGGKCAITESVLERYYLSLCNTPNVGKWDNGFAKLIGSLPFDHKFDDEEIIALGQAMDRFQNDVDSGKHGSANGSWKLRAPLARAMARKTPMPKGLWLAKTEREPGREHGICADRFGMGMWDVIREKANRSLREIDEEITAMYYCDEDDVEVERLVVPGANEVINLFDFVGKWHFRWFRERDGELDVEPSNVIVFDSKEEATQTQDARGRFHKYGAHDRVAAYVGIRQPSGDIPVYTWEDGKFVKVQGSWICNESETPFLFAQEGRIRNELRWMQGDPEQQARYSWVRANMTRAARIACAAYAAQYGYGMKDAAQKAFDYAFNPANHCNLFQLRHVAAVFEQELRSALIARRLAMAEADQSIMDWYPEAIDDGNVA